MSKLNVLLVLCLFVSCAAGCGGSSTAPAPPPGVEPSPTPTELAEPLSQDPGGTEPPPELTPDPDQKVSPAYDIYVGLTLTGPPCGGYTNSGGFVHFSLDSAFHNVRFAPPQEGFGMSSGGFHTGDLFPGITISGEGQVDGFDLCPAYDGDRELACVVTEGPKGLEPDLMVDPYNLALPLAGPTPPTEPSEALALTYRVGLVEGLGPLMRWECGGFYLGAFGGPYDGDLEISFLLPWTQVMAGEDVTRELMYEDGFYTGRWTLRLVPAAGN